MRGRLGQGMDGYGGWVTNALWCYGLRYQPRNSGLTAQMNQRMMANLRRRHECRLRLPTISFCLTLINEGVQHSL
jgi:hypothetical protein